MHALIIPNILYGTIRCGRPSNYFSCAPFKFSTPIFHYLPYSSQYIFLLNETEKENKSEKNSEGSVLL